MLRVGFRQTAGSSQGRAVANTGQDVLQVAASTTVVQHLAPGDHGQTVPLGPPPQTGFLLDLSFKDLLATRCPKLFLDPFELQYFPGATFDILLLIQPPNTFVVRPAG